MKGNQMQVIGSSAEAEAIAPLRSKTVAERAKFLHELYALGWKSLGSGSYREAFLSPSGVVYKVQRQGGFRRRCSANENEYRVVQEFKSGQRHVPDYIYIPDAMLWETSDDPDDTVIAMEYIKGSHPVNCYVDTWDGRAHCQCGELDPDTNQCPNMPLMEEVSSIDIIGDIHEENVIVMEDGRFAVIDLQF